MSVLNAVPVRVGATRAGEEDTRGLDFSAALPTGDSLASVTSVTLVRRDGVTTGANDLAITPAGAPGPWIIGTTVNWWHKSVASIAATGAVDYQGTVTVVTSLGRAPLIRDFYILVVPGLG